MSIATTPLLANSKKHTFGITVEQLCALVDDPRRRQLLLAEYGGISGICRALGVDPTLGLSPDESFEPTYGVVAIARAAGLSSCKNAEPFEARKAVFGRNLIPEAPQKTMLALIWSACNDQTLIMLTVAALVSLLVGIWEDHSIDHPADEPKVGWVDGVAIIAAVAVVVITNSINDYEKEKQFRKLAIEKENRSAKVIRGGITYHIDTRDIVVGDMLFLEAGDVSTVDCLYMSGYSLRCDESTATGESQHAKKQTEDIIYSGSKILQGVAKGVVIAVGEHSFSGRAITLMRDVQDESTPLLRKLNVLADQIAKFGFVAAGLMFCVLLIKMIVVNAWFHHGTPTSEYMSELIAIVIQAITVIVVAVPEGLPMAVTLALAFATKEMLKDNNLVRYLSACETMGNATAVCSDKTGTLTENKMTVVRALLAERSFSIYEQGGFIKAWCRSVHSSALDLMAEGIALNSTVFEDRAKFVGSTTEAAMIDFIQHLGYDYLSIRSSNRTVGVYPFSSEAKSMTTVIQIHQGSALWHQAANEGLQFRVHTKGAAETILRLCTHAVDACGRAQPLRPANRNQYETLINQYAAQSLRPLALAYRDVDAATCHAFHTDDPPLESLVLLGIIGIQDPLRPGVVESVQAFQHAGVFVRMITGDNLETAKAIAKESRILTAGGIAMTGPDFRRLSAKEQSRVLPRLQVLARSSPIDKTLVVSRLQELGEVVAMTGDGTNDGPALKLANVGFAMGITGTEVAKEASDIILMDDNITSILQALKWGRAINDGVRKFLTFQLTVNIAAVVVSFVSATASSESILSAVQLLWVNMIMDTFAALALATEPLSEQVLHRKPLSKHASLIDWRMRRMILGQALFQITVNLLLMYYGDAVFGLDPVQDHSVLKTMIFNVFVFMQVFNELNCRRIDDQFNILRGITKDYLFLAIQALVVVGQICIVQYGGLAFKTVPLNMTQWMCTLAIGALSIPAGFLIRLLPSSIPFLWTANTGEDEFKREVSYARLRWEYALQYAIHLTRQETIKKSGIYATRCSE